MSKIAKKWASDNELGRENANQAIHHANDSDNIPLLVAAIKDAARDNSGENVGFLFEIAESALQSHR